MARKRRSAGDFPILSEHWGDEINFEMPPSKKSAQPDTLIDGHEHQLDGNGYLSIEVQEPEAGVGDRKRGKNTAREQRRRERRSAEDERGRWE